MTSPIRVLSDQAINKIAAGEVIENSASVVKELVENALDADADEITVEIRGGGRQLIRITDNGYGMMADDALLSLERHATSKIRSDDEIADISTMGFRGEAIPSIASISKFALITCSRSGDAEAPEATMILVEGGKVLKYCSAARSAGTTIEVKALFFNVPARRKFQKSPSHDQGEIVKVMTLLALGNPHVKFQLIANNETLLSVPARQKVRDRISETLGSDLVSATCPIEINSDGFQMTGYIGTPAYTRPNRVGQYLFINHRPVVSSLVSSAVKDGYGTTLEQNRFPVFVLFLTLSGDLVDVNVHPQKREVRLRERAKIKETLYHAVEQALQEGSLPLPSAVEYPSSFHTHATMTAHPDTPPWKTACLSLPTSIDLEDTLPPPPMPPEPPVEDLELLTLSPSVGSPQVLATVPGYIIVDSSMALSATQADATLTLIDQKAAHSRVLFEQLNTRLEDPAAEPLEVQPLLVPITLEFSTPEAIIIGDSIEDLQNMGLEMHQCGPNAFMVDAIPQIFDPNTLQDAICDIVEELRQSQSSRVALKEKQQRLAMAATRHAVSTEKRLSLEQAQGLVSRLFQCNTPQHCPKGAPCFLSFSREALDKLFQANLSKYHAVTIP